jgi:hypothetical protein
MSEQSKNIPKYESYKYAFNRIEEAIEKGFYLEATVMAESIISDRLLNYLSMKSYPKPYHHKTALGTLIRSWRELDQKVFYKDREDLIDDIDNWREDRNECAHGLAKSNPGTPTKPVEEFVQKAFSCAVEGQQLAKYICNWHTTEKRKHMQAALLSNL